MPPEPTQGDRREPPRGRAADDDDDWQEHAVDPRTDRE